MDNFFRNRLIGWIGIIKGPMFIEFWIFSMDYGYHQVIGLFQGRKESLYLGLFFLSNFPGPTFISCLKYVSIPDSRVHMQCFAFTLTSINLVYRARIIALPRF